MSPTLEYAITLYVSASLVCCTAVLVAATIRYCTSKLYEVRKYARDQKWDCESWINSRN